MPLRESITRHCAMDDVEMKLRRLPPIRAAHRRSGAAQSGPGRAGRNVDLCRRQLDLERESSLLLQSVETVLAENDGLRVGLGGRRRD